VTEDCSYATIAECRNVILSGNRGACNRNPAWDPGRRFHRVVFLQMRR
jgi:hypothetical protein